MVTVKEAKTRSELRKFADFSNKLYKGVPNYTPSTYSDDIEDWMEDKNPAFEYCKAKAFLAYRDGKIVGRIGAILSDKANQKWGHKRMRFTCVDFIDDNEVSDALFKTVEDWAREMGCLEVHGPLGFSDMDREGMLVEGFDQPSLFFTYYNFPYYNDHMARMGYTKDTDWVEFFINIPDKPIEKLERMADLVMRRYKLKPIRFKSRGEIKPYVTKVFTLLNQAYADLYGVVPLTERQVARYATKFLPLMSPDFISIVENEQGEVVAFGITSPSLTKAFQKSNGRMLPFGFIHFLNAQISKKNDKMDMYLVAVRPDLQGTGINAILINEIMRNAIARGMKYTETSPELETNTKVAAQWKFFDTVQHKRRRCYIKAL